jgi:hypothetical protein
LSEEAFGIEKEFMAAILREVRDGKAQLPEFQRGWVWPVENIQSLLASISLAYPVGTIMMLRTGGQGVRFKQRPVEGATPPPAAHADRLILDGQQRLTSLFQSIMLDVPVQAQDSRKKPVTGWFYIDMLKALDPNQDREEAIRFIPADKRVKSFRNEVLEDYSTAESEYAAHLFPLNRALEPQKWRSAFNKHWGHAPEQTELWDAFEEQVIDKFKSYQLPVIELGKETHRQAVCQVFEKVNTGGVTLTVFELLTATFAADEFDLRRDWQERERQFKTADKKVLHEVANTDFLQSISLLATREAREQALKGGQEEEKAPRIGCRRQEMLALSLSSYQRFAPLVVEGLGRAAKFLHTQHFFDTKFLPYGSQLVPMAAIFAVLGKESETAGAQEKIARWFWCGVMGELYGGTTETRFSRDLPEVVQWVRGGPEPRTVTEALFAAGRLLTLRTRISAAYKGIYALLLREGAKDWRTGKEGTIANYFDEATDIHHIFPKAWCQQHGIPAARYDSIINKTPLSAHTNRVIGGRAPSDYLKRVASGAGISDTQLDRYLATHLIEPATLRADAFQAFFEQRAQGLLAHIERAMGKAAAAEAAPEEPDERLTYDDLGTEDLEPEDDAA